MTFPIIANVLILIVSVVVLVMGRKQQGTKVWRIVAILMLIFSLVTLYALLFLFRSPFFSGPW